MLGSQTCREPIRNHRDLRVNFQLRDAAVLAGRSVLNFAASVEPPQDYAAVPFDSPELSVKVIAAKSDDASSDTHDLYTVMPVILSPDTTSSWRAPVDIVLVVDISGSMGETVECPDGGEGGASLTKMELVIHAMQTIVQILNSNDRLGVVTFTSRAEIISPMVQMNDANKEALASKINMLRPDADTNLWAGIAEAYKLLNSSGELAGDSTGRGVGGLFVLTDGEATSSTNPPRGIVATLQRLRENTPQAYSGLLYTFAFGYRLDSRLLSDLAAFGGGMYSFLPDGGFVGTAFINNLANLLCVVATDATLKIEAATEDGVEIIESSILCARNVVKNDWGYTVPVGVVLSGQDNSPLCLTIRVPKSTAANEDSALISVSLQYSCSKERRERALIKDCASALSRRQVCEAKPLHEQELRAQMFRIRFVKLVDALLSKDKSMSQLSFDLRSGLTESLQQRVQEFSVSLNTYLDANNDFEASDRRSAYKRISALREDVDGQVAEACSRVDWMVKWGAHYLPSLARAHDLHQRNNFKDKGIQFYGDGLFCRWRDAAEDIFLTIKAPTPAALQRQAWSPSPSSPGAPAAPPAVSMRSYYNAASGCFHEDSLVLMEDGASALPCKSIRRGDVVYGGGVVDCVLQTVLLDGAIDLVHVPAAQADPRGGLRKTGRSGEQALRLTPWHPIRVYEAGTERCVWKFPIDLVRKDGGGACKKVVTNCHSVYSFVVVAKKGAYGSGAEYKSEIVVDGVAAITLCHNIQNDKVASHPFFGTERVVASLKRSRDYASAGGVVRVAQGGGFVRGTDGLICDLAHEKAV